MFCAVGVRLGFSHQTFSIERTEVPPQVEEENVPNDLVVREEPQSASVPEDAEVSPDSAVSTEHEEDADTPADDHETPTYALHEAAPDTVRIVPFYSQFSDISAAKWRKVGCGIASLAMLIEYYKPHNTSVDTLLDEGIAAGAFLADQGWIHQGLIGLARQHGLTGSTHDLSELSMERAFDDLTDAVETGPVMVSVHYTFEPTNPIPHLVVVTDIEGDTVHYNDPSEPSGNGAITAEKFKNAWKQRYIEIRPAA